MPLVEAVCYKASMASRTTAMHASTRTKDGSAHVVGIRNLQVVITARDGCWFAQGLEIDYAAEGRSLDDVKRVFEEGLAMTINANLKRFGNIKHLLKRAAPPAAWRVAEGRIHRRYSQVSAHRFPFEIQFLEAAA